MSNTTTLKGLEQIDDHIPFRVVDLFYLLTQGWQTTPTLGFIPQPRWGSERLDVPSSPPQLRRGWRWPVQRRGGAIACRQARNFAEAPEAFHPVRLA